MPASCHCACNIYLPEVYLYKEAWYFFLKKELVLPGNKIKFGSKWFTISKFIPPCSTIICWRAQISQVISGSIRKYVLIFFTDNGMSWIWWSNIVLLISLFTLSKSRRQMIETLLWYYLRSIPHWWTLLVTIYVTYWLLLCY